MANRKTTQLALLNITTQRHGDNIGINNDLIKSIASKKYAYYALQIDVAEWRIPKRVQQILDRPSRRVGLAHVDGIVQAGVAARRVVEQRNGAGNGLGLVEVQSLPDPPDAVEHGVVKPEDGVHGRGEEVAGVAADAKVARGVQAQEPLGEAALELVLERLNVRGGAAQGEVEQVARGEPGRCRVGAEVALQAARVVGETRVDLGLTRHGG